MFRLLRIIRKDKLFPVDKSNKPQYCETTALTALF